MIISEERQKRILQEVDKVSVDLLAREPFFGHFFTGMIRRVSNEISTLGVGITEGKQIQLVINPDFWDTKLTTPEYRYGLIKHELLHIVFKHILVRDDYSLKMLFNIAADIVVNQYINHEYLPESPVLFEDFEILGYRRGEDIGYYYSFLLDVIHNRVNSNSNKRRKNARKRLASLLEGANEHMDRHRDWDQFDTLPAAAHGVLENSIDQALNRTLSRTDRHGQESLPHPLRSQLEALRNLGASRVHWRRVLRLFSGTSQASRLQNTIRRPSKRYGTTPGTRLVRKQRLLVAVDTSASINKEELEAFFNEIHHLWRLSVKLMVVAVDSSIRESFEYTGKRKLEVSGRGGTSFDPVFAFAKEQWKPDGLLYFTDGYGPVPTINIRPPVLWLITQQGITTESESWNDLPGRKVKMTI